MYKIKNNSNLVDSISGFATHFFISINTSFKVFDLDCYDQLISGMGTTEPQQ